MTNFKHWMNSTNYPWTNLDTKNLDWFINAMQILYEDWEAYSKDFDVMKEWLINYLREYEVTIKDFIVEYIKTDPDKAILDKFLDILGYVVPDFYDSDSDCDNILQAVNSGKTVNLNGQTYTLDKTLVINKDNVTIKNGTIVLNNNSNTPFTITVGGNNILFEDVHFIIPKYEELKNTESYNGVQFFKCSYVTIKDCTFTALNTRVNGYIDFYNKWDNVLLDGCTFHINTHYNGEGHLGGMWCRTVGGSDCHDLTIKDCNYISDSNDEALAIWYKAGSSIENVKIINTKFKVQCQAYAVHVSAEHVSINDCDFYSDAPNAILKLYSHDDVYGSDVVISRCHFEDESDGTKLQYKTIDTNGLYTAYANFCTFNGKRVAFDGIVLTSCIINASSNSCICGKVDFYNCELNVIQPSNSFISRSVIFKGCIINHNGSNFINTASSDTESVIILEECTCNLSDILFIVRYSGKKFIFKGNTFYGYKLRLSSIRSTDVLMNNLFFTGHDNPQTPPVGYETNVFTTL